MRKPTLSKSVMNGLAHMKVYTDASLYELQNVYDTKEMQDILRAIRWVNAMQNYRDKKHGNP